ncbi:sensor histidine kinase [Actinomadura nitritigenes]|uniref:sensor histidine kinase n=1 Tax=Actinomadura nitritigenes TaxID=134602 RepID=UPI003D930C5B
MAAISRVRAGAALPGVVFAGACAARAGAAFGAQGVSPADWAVTVVLLGVPVVTGYLLRLRAPGTPVGAALSWVGAAPAAVFAVEDWGETVTASHPWPGAEILYMLKLGAWVWNLAGFAALCLVFPDGLLPGRGWRIAAAGAVAAGVWLNLTMSFVQPADEMDPHVRERFVLVIPRPAALTAAAVAFAGVLAALVVCVSTVVVRYRRGGTVVREQLRWLMLGAGAVPVLLAGGWAAEMLGAPTDVAYLGFIVAMVVAVPGAIAVAVLRHDLFDVDRLLGATLAWLLTSLLSAATFAALVYGTAVLAGAGTRVGLTGAAFATAICLPPTHRVLHGLAGRLVDRERTVMDARVGEFVRRVRDGEAEPEEAEELMRSVLGDPGLRLLVRLPSGPSGAYVDLAGVPAEVPEGAACVPLTAGGAEAGVIVLEAASARGLRRAREVASQARLPIEVSRLRLELRTALEETRSSRERLALAAAAERERLARDLHDGTQQQIIAVGMRLRSAQRALDPAHSVHRDLEAAVDALADTVADLRRLAHGVRPGRLEDGLPTALRALVAGCPVPVEIEVADVTASEAVAMTAYFVVAEAVANTLKHARASTIHVVVGPHRGGLRVEVSDDGAGGARPAFGLTSIRDRVASVGGELTVRSPAGSGTTIRATF